VGKVLRRLGFGKLAAFEPKPPVVRYQRERPGKLIHIDVKKARPHRGGRAPHHRQPPRYRRGAGWEYVHVCVDDASRLAYGEVLSDERKESAVPFFECALAWFAGLGVTIERVMTGRLRVSAVCDMLYLFNTVFFSFGLGVGRYANSGNRDC
jgi:hypothetical protein